jgi:mono/diheme cytochrome c family protein/DNA-binding beta-propeller fold protein YncE
MHNTNNDSARSAGASRVTAASSNAAPPKIERIGGRAGGGVALATVEGQRIAYVADADDRSLRVIDVRDQKELSTFPLPGAPAMLAILSDGRIAVTLRDANQVAILSGAGTASSPLQIEKRISVAVEPIGLAITPDEATLLVTSGWGHTLTALDTKKFETRFTQDLPRDPRAVIASDDGKRAFIAHATGPAVSAIDLVKAAANAKTAIYKLPLRNISVDGEEDAASRGGAFSASRHACQGFALVESRLPEGRIFAPHTLAFTDSSNDDSGGYGSSPGLEPEVFDVAVIDEDSATAMKASLAVSLLADSDETPCPLPRAAAAGKNGALYVTCLGSNALIELDGSVVNPHYAQLRSWNVPTGPTALAVDDEAGRAYVFSQFTHSLTTIALDVPGQLVIESLTLSEQNPLDEKIARGRELFHTTDDFRISGDGRACATCHVDGREDSLVWASPDGPRQTPMLAGRLAKTAPYGWNGNGKDLPAHVKKTFSRLRGSGLQGDDRDDLIAYIQSLPTPTALNTTTSKAESDLVARGEKIFDAPETGCANCHGDDGRTPDGEQHDVKSASGEAHKKFDTPSLEFAGATAPYFHDGRYATLSELLKKSDGKMGNTKQLSEDDLAALEAFVRTR